MNEYQRKTGRYLFLNYSMKIKKVEEDVNLGAKQKQNNTIQKQRSPKRMAEANERVWKTMLHFEGVD